MAEGKTSKARHRTPLMITLQYSLFRFAINGNIAYGNVEEDRTTINFADLTTRILAIKYRYAINMII